MCSSAYFSYIDASMYSGSARKSVSEATYVAQHRHSVGQLSQCSLVAWIVTQRLFKLHSLSISTRWCSCRRSAFTLSPSWLQDGTNAGNPRQTRLCWQCALCSSARIPVLTPQYSYGAHWKCIHSTRRERAKFDVSCYLWTSTHSYGQAHIRTKKEYG